MVDVSNFPANSVRGKQNAEPEQEDKKIEQLTEEPATRRKKPLGKRISDMFFGGDAKSAGEYMVYEVLLPAAKDMIAEAGAQGIERLIFGETRRRRGGPSAPMSGPTGHISYNRYSSPQKTPTRSISRRARAQHDFDEIVLQSRDEAERVIDRMFDLIGRYEAATVSDLYELVGLNSTHTDQNWGWTDLRGASVSRIRSGGYLLNLPEPTPL